MKRISHGFYATIFNVVYLALALNALLAVGCLPLLVVLITTDPAHSWPLIAVTAPLAAPAVAGAFRAYREFGSNGLTPAKAFFTGIRQTWARALAIGGMASAVLTILVVDVSMLANTTVGVLVVPVLAVLVIIAAGTAMVALAAIAEAPTARLRDVLTAALTLSVRRWYVTAVSLAVGGVQAAVFVNAPAIGVGVTAAAVLYLIWANSRFTLRPVLDLEEVATA